MLPGVGSLADLWRQHRHHQVVAASVVGLGAAAAVGAVVLTFDRAWVAMNPVPVAIAAVLAVLPIFSFLRQTVRRAKIPLDDERRRAVVAKLRTLREAYLQKRGGKKIDWAAFDTVVPDGRLDKQELRGYLEALARDPNAVIAHSELELELGDERPTHPKTRRRILFLAREFGPGGPAEG